MFYYLEGIVSLIEPGIAVVDVQGAGYACQVSATTLSRLETGKRARLYTYCAIRAESFDIFGFLDTGEKRCFLQLTSVSGVGPKAALSILSSNTPESLALAVINENEAPITAAPGIGKKLAQRIILELKDKIGKEAASLKASGYVPPAAGGEGAAARDAAAALAVLGYSQGEVSQAMRGIDITGLSVEEIVRQVLKNSLK